MSKESLASKAHPSYAVAIEIANACPEALFCGFKTKPKADGTHAKIPVSKNGTGVGADIDHDQLVNCSGLNQMIYPPNGADYWGIFMQSRMTYDPFNELVLTILDLDTKRSTAPRDIRMVKLMDQAKERGLLTERSHSKKGGHIIFLAKPDETLPPKIDLGNHQEIEIFGHPGSAGKNVMLTGDSMRGNLIELGCTVKEFLATAGIQINEPKPIAPPNQSFDFTTMLSKGSQSDFDKAVDALNAINPDIDYEDWIAIGQALHSEFGEQGRNAWYAWSSLGSKYQGEKDLESHWKSFGKKDGVKLGTLYKHAMDHGWQQPTKQTERKSAVEDFAAVISQAQAPATEDAPQGWPERHLSIGSIRPIRYMVKGFWAHSFMVLAGQPGIGKTTAIISLCLVMAGIQAKDCQLTATKKRKTIIVTEDSDQVERTLTGYARHYGISTKALSDWFVIIDAKRSQVKDLLTLAHNVIHHTIDNVRPLLVLDTANATMDIDNENDNSEVGSYIAALKQTIYIQLDTPVCIITHTNKTISKADSDATARGASAFTGDATLTGVLFEDETKTRYMRLVKTRYQPNFREIKFHSDVFADTVLDEDGDIQEQMVLLVVPEMSSEEDRKQAANDRQNDKRQQQVQDAADAACNFVQSMINAKGQVIMRRGSGRPAVPKELQGMHQLEWADIYQAVPQANQSYARRAVGEAILQRFVQDQSSSGWVQIK
jgi:RecA-family ATPase